tara:strand:+ start:601 stop:1446 length:846 start_codon:yes stop_codon:yes gene_type:complete
MSEKKRSLGRGLDSLLGERAERSAQGVLEVPLEDLVPGQYQPRNKMHKSTLEELSKSIREQGVLQPILARKKATKGYEIVVGERRWRAAQLAGLKTIPTLIKELNNDQSAKIALIENLQREDLNAMDQARGLQRLQVEFNLSQQDLAVSVGKSRSTVTNLLRLTNLSPFTQDLLETGKIEMGHARALLAAKQEDQESLAREVASKNLSVRQVERLVSAENGQPGKKRKPKSKDPNTIKLEKEISESVGARVDISHNSKGAGKLVINFRNLDQLQGILNKIK